MQEDEVSPVLSYEHALHLVQVIAKRGGEIQPLEEIAEELKNRLMTEARQKALREFAKNLRESATIERVDFSGDQPG